MTVRTLLATIDSAELTEWMAFERLEAFGTLADDFRAGTVAAAVYNSRRTERTSPYLKVEDFMPSIDAALSRRTAALAPVVDTLTPDQHTALFDACIFGMTQQ